jgi:hypothetical protein
MRGAEAEDMDTAAGARNPQSAVLEAAGPMGFFAVRGGGAEALVVGLVVVVLLVLTRKMIRAAGDPDGADDRRPPGPKALR